jgi:hypothetical protein
MLYTEYNTTLDNLNAHLDEYGVAIIQNVLSEPECVNLRNQIWSELKHVTQNRFDISGGKMWR